VSGFTLNGGHHEQGRDHQRLFFGVGSRRIWAGIERRLADEFSFTSPNDDDHIDKRQFKEKCSPESERMRRFEVDKVLESDGEAFARYQLWTTDGKVIRNTEYFRFDGDRIRDIEVCFGTGVGFPSQRA
jgi:hypothetical protein